MIQITCRLVGRDGMSIRTDPLPIDRDEALKLADTMADSLVAIGKINGKVYRKVAVPRATGTLVQVMSFNPNSVKLTSGGLVCVFSFEEL